MSPTSQDFQTHSSTESSYHPVMIGSVRIPGNLFLAPLAGFTDKAFRSICISQGADLTYSEMVSAEAIARENTKTQHLTDRAHGEERFAIQLFMPDADTAARAVERVMKAHPTIIDVNCGCPVPKVVKTGAGSALMKDPEAIRSIVQALVAGSDVPVTVKIRSGWDHSSMNFIEAAAAAVEGGASAVTLHPRTRAQGYSGLANWEHLRELVSAMPGIPVFGSGDLHTPQDAQRMLQETGVSGVMFARGAIGNPAIFAETRHCLGARELSDALEPSDEGLLHRQVALLLEHLRLCIEDKGEAHACREMRKHACAYTKGFPGSSRVRNELIHAETFEKYHEVLTAWLATDPLISVPPLAHT